MPFIHLNKTVNSIHIYAQPRLVTEHNVVTYRYLVWMDVSANQHIQLLI